MGVAKTKRAKRSLTAGRPPTLQKPKSISRKATRTLINNIHTLEKRKQKAIEKGDKAEETAIEAEIAALGGIEQYQQASLQGQRIDRGGDSSRVLVEWLKPIQPFRKPGTQRLRMLEVGALSTSNACSKSEYFDIERIDLNSQGEGILQQDFMKRPLPKNHREKFDIISLSLVLNFVPDPKSRGDMLLRTLDFLHDPSGIKPTPWSTLFPSLFLVLPAPCVLNSRYMDEAKLKAMMASLDYEMIESKITQKLVYYLWKRRPHIPNARMDFAKKELRPGASRNNFTIVIKGAG